MKQILVVDDSHVEQVLLSGLLKKEYKVLEAVSGEAALDILRRQFKSISAIILDIMLPGIDGFEVLTKLKSNALWRSIPVIVTTGMQDESTQIKALESGANAFVTKPFNQALLLQMLRNTIVLCETAALANAAMKDSLTGLYTRDAFFIEAEKLIRQREPGYYMLSCFDIDNFKVINDQHGTESGDEVLCHVAECLAECAQSVGSIVCRLMADRFAALYPAADTNSEIVKNAHRIMVAPQCIARKISIRIGRYLVENLTLSVSSMYDRATLAQDSVKGRYDVYIAQYQESMRDRLLAEQQIVMEMRGALKSGQFEPWFQPQYNHATGALIGSEALVRWKRPDGTLISPGQFIPVFERNGFIYELDKYIWEQVCVLLRRWLDEGREPMPVSVNVSRHDVFHKGFLRFITGLMDRYALPKELLRLEITESAFTESPNQIVSIVNALIDAGFTVEIDDFGSGYSSLNTLKDVPAQILKLDMRFIESAENSQRGGNIVESVIRMAKWLGMSVIAEGVETREQADYLSSIGCNIMQGYFYARPMPLKDYEAVLGNARKNRELSDLNIVESFDSSAFWTAESLDTLVFNHFSGGAFIFEHYRGHCEMLRINSEFAETVCSQMTDDEILKREPFSAFDGDTNEKAFAAIKRARESGKREAFEAYSTQFSLPGHGEYLRVSIRRIAEAGERSLFYGYVDNITAQKKAEQKERSITTQLQLIMNHINGGVAASVVRDGKVTYLFANDRYYELMGRTQKEYTAQFTGEFHVIHPDDRARVNGIIAKACADLKPYSAEFRIVQPDGAIRWVFSDITIVDLPGVDEPVHLAMVNDITARKEAEQQERETSQQLRFLNAMSKGLLSKPDAEEAILDSMQMVLEYFGGDRVYIIEYKDGLSSNTYEVCRAGVAPQKDNLQNIPLDSIPFWKTAFDDAAIISIDTETLPPDREMERALLEMQGIDSMVAAPIHENGVYSGFIGIDNPQHRQQQQRDALPALGDYASVLLTRRDLLLRIKSESRIVKAVMDGVPGGFCRFRLTNDGRLSESYYSRGYLSMLGMTHEQIDQITCNDILAMVHPDDVPRLKSAIAHTAEGKELHDLRYRLRSDGGRAYLTVSIHAKADTDEQGNTFVNVYYSDATELIAAEARQAELLDNLPCGAALYEYDGKTLSVKHLNRHYWEMVGRVGKDYDDISFIDAVHADDRVLIAQELESAIRQDREFDANIRILYGKNAYRPFHIIGNIVKKPGGGYRIYAAYTPIDSDEMAVQSMLRLALDAMMDSSEDFSFVKDAQGRYVSVSNSVVDFLGFESETDILGKSDAELFTEAVAKKYTVDDCRILSTGEVVLDNEESALGADGALRFISTSKYPLRDAHGNIIGLYGISRNTTAFHAAQFELGALLHSIPSGILKYSADEKAEFAYVNRNLVESLGYTEQTFREKFHNCFREMIYVEDRAYAFGEIERQEGNGGIGKFDYRIEAADGSLRWFHDEGVKVSDESGKEWYYVTLTDITNQRAAENIARRRDEEFRLAVNDSGMIICRYDIARRTMLMPDRAVVKYGFKKELHPFPECAIAGGEIGEDSVEAVSAFFDSILAGKPDGTIRYQRKLNGAWRWLEARYFSVFSGNGSPESAVVSFRDVTEQIQTEQRADTDPLTGLLNRAAFSERMGALLANGSDDVLHALLMFDLDHFKQINDTYGHSSGDETLIRFGEVLTSCVRAEDMVCHLGGDEFFICLCWFTNRSDIESRAKRICRKIKAAFPRDMQVSTSIGIAVAPDDGTDFETLYHKADSALYHVKEHGKGSYAFYNEDIGEKNGLRERDGGEKR